MDEIGADVVDAWRIESVWECGGSVNRCMQAESDSMILARVAMGEAPQSLSDRVYVMWSIRLRAALGFKEALPGYLAVPDRWGPETSIAVEALCNGGCQYSPVRAADGIYFPCADLPEGHALRSMLCPTDEQLLDFYWTWTFAEAIAFANFDDFPEDLRGYESFRSPEITWHGQRNREGGLLSRQFFPRGNIWRDEFPQDNVFWEEFAGAAPTDLPPTRTPDPGPTLTALPLTATATATAIPATPTVLSYEEGEELQNGDQSMTVFAMLSAFVAPGLILIGAFLQQLTSDQTALLSFLILGIVQVIKVVWIGVAKRPKPTKTQMRFFVFVISFPVGLIFAAESFPVYAGDPMAFVQALFAYGTVVLIQAGLVYDYVGDGVFGWLDANILRRKNGKAPILAP